MALTFLMIGCLEEKYEVLDVERQTGNIWLLNEEKTQTVMAWVPADHPKFSSIKEGMIIPYRPHKGFIFPATPENNRRIIRPMEEVPDEIIDLIHNNLVKNYK